MKGNKLYLNKDERRFLEKSHKRKSNLRIRNTSLILSVITGLSILSYYLNDSLIELGKQTAIAQNKTIEAQDSARVAQAERKRAEDSAMVAILARQRAQDSADVAIEQRKRAEDSAQVAILERGRAQDSAKVAVAQRKRAEDSAKAAQTQRSIALKEAEENYKRRLLVIGKNLISASGEIQAPSLNALLMVQAYKFLKENGGNLSEPNLYSALFNANKNLLNRYPYEYSSRKGEISSIVYDPTQRKYIISNKSGNYFSWESSKIIPSTLKAESKNGTYGLIAASRDGKYLAKLKENKKVSIYKGADRVNEIASIQLKSFKPNCFSFDMKNEALFFADGKELFKLDIKNNSITKQFSSNNLILAVAVHPTKRIIALASGNIIELWDTASKRKFRSISGHSSKVSDLDFDPKGKYLASSSWDKSIKVWNAVSWSILININDHDAWVTSIKFSNKGSWIISAAKDGLAKAWPVSTSYYAESICNNVNRKLSDGEWEQYIAPDIPKESACESLNNLTSSSP